MFAAVTWFDFDAYPEYFWTILGIGLAFGALLVLMDVLEEHSGILKRLDRARAKKEGDVQHGVR